MEFTVLFDFPVMFTFFHNIKLKEIQITHTSCNGRMDWEREAGGELSPAV